MTMIEKLKQYSKANEVHRHLMRAGESEEVKALFEIIEEAEYRVYKRINSCMLQDIKSMEEICGKLKVL
jgi:hypothetical protein